MDISELKKPLSILDIDFRIQSINKGGYATILAYKDARVDMNRLDEVCGQENWQRDHKEVKGVIYCGIGIRSTELTDEDGKILTDSYWIWKWDAGTESFTEKQKGEASDSFKRAGFNWGIGRELYDYPIIQIKLKICTKNSDGKYNNDGEYYLDSSGKAKTTWNLKLKDWVWGSEFKDDELIKLAAKDSNDKLRFNWKLKIEEDGK